MEEGADYAISLKGDQGNLYEEVQLFLEDAAKKDFSGIDHDFHEDTDGDHNRMEIGRHWAVSDVDRLDEKHEWKDLTTIVILKACRDCRCLGKIPGVKRNWMRLPCKTILVMFLHMG